MLRIAGMELNMEKYNLYMGDKGEDLASKYLKRRGYKILERQYRCQLGEIDIIASRKDFVVFVEVKTRFDNAYGTPASAVSYIKRKRIIQIASVYLERFPDKSARFDIIEVIGNMKDGKFHKVSIDHIENAFWEE